MRTILITGAGGLVGTHLVALLAESDRLHALGRQAPEGASPIPADLSRPIDVTSLPERIDAVVYLAQSSRFREFPAGAADMFEVNVARPLELVAEAHRRGARSFVYASTGSVYAPGPDPATEEGPTPANGFYASSKLAAEQLLRAWGELLPVQILRFFFVYGRGQKRDMLLPRLADSIRDGWAITLQGEEGLHFQPLHAVDAARAVAAALALDGSNVINVAGPEALSMRRACEVIGERLGRAPMFEQAPGPAPRLLADTGRMAAIIGRPTVLFDEGVAGIIEG